MTPLRSKMVREMQLQRLATKTQEAYVRCVRDLAKHYRCSPDRLTVEQVRQYVHYLLTERKLSSSSCNLALAAFKFFYRKVLGNEQFKLKVRYKRSGRLLEVLNRGPCAVKSPGDRLCGP